MKMQKKKRQKDKIWQKLEHKNVKPLESKKNKTFKKFNIDELTMRLPNPSKTRYFKNKQKQQTL